MPLSTTHAAEKQEVARRTTWTSIAVNSGLTAAQLVVGFVAHSQALIADGVHSLADITQARRILGYEPKIMFEEGLRKTVEWYRANG